MPRRLSFHLLATLLVGLALSTSAAGTTFTAIDFPGAVSTRAFGINDKGRVVGRYQDSGGNVHGFLLKNGAFTAIDVPGATGFTVARGINNSGDIVGNYVDSSGI